MQTSGFCKFFFSFYVSGLVSCHPLQRVMLEVMGARSRQRRKSCQHESHHKECDASRPTCVLGHPWRHKLAAICLILQDIRDLLSAGCSKHSLDTTCYQGMGWQISPGSQWTRKLQLLSLLLPFFAPYFLLMGCPGTSAGLHRQPGILTISNCLLLCFWHFYLTEHAELSFLFQTPSIGKL